MLTNWEQQETSRQWTDSARHMSEAFYDLSEQEEKRATGWLEREC